MVLYVYIKDMSKFKYMDKLNELGMCVCEDNKCVCIIPRFLYKKIIKDKDAKKYIVKIDEYEALIKAVDFMFKKIKKR